MTRREQETARKRLAQAGFIEEARRGVPARLYFRVNIETLEAALAALSESYKAKRKTVENSNEIHSMADSANLVCTNGAPSMAESANQECTDAPIKSGGKRQSITEITTETTAEITAEGLSGPDRPDAPMPPSSETATEPERPDAAIQNGRYWGTQDDLDLATWMWERLAEQLGQDKPRVPNLARWANTIRLMREQDGRELRHIRALYDWCRQHEFWSANVQSPDKLREKWSQLALQRKSERRKAPAQTGLDRAAELRRIHEQRTSAHQGVTYEHH